MLDLILYFQFKDMIGYEIIYNNMMNDNLMKDKLLF